MVIPLCQRCISLHDFQELGSPITFVLFSLAEPRQKWQDKTLVSLVSLVHDTYDTHDTPENL